MNISSRLGVPNPLGGKMTDHPAQEPEEIEDPAADEGLDSQAQELLDTDSATAEYVDAPNGTKEVLPWSSSPQQD
jgi:hypothetical protein